MPSCLAYLLFSVCLLSSAPHGPLMKCGTAAIIGRPNSGKSTLLNALVGQKISIVSTKPQTTRHRILGITNEARGQIVFMDTPGIHKPAYAMNRRMLHTVYQGLKDVDVVILVVDASISFGAGENFVLETVKRAQVPSFLLLNKIDKIAKTVLLPMMQRYGAAHNFVEIIPISAKSGENLDLLREKIFDNLPEGEPLYEAEQITDRSERFLASEFIREKLLERVREELPYTSAVLIKKFDESRRSDQNLVVIEADILVERKSQQGIIIGAQASQLRDLGIAARSDLEQLLGCKVFLGLQVRTARNWRNDESVLDELELGR
jgi:GTP-binding protein Era